MGRESPWTEVVAGIETRLAPHGLDLVHPFRVSWFNGAVEPEAALPDLGRDDALGVLVASTRAIWPRFIAAREDLSSGLAREEHPLDTYVTRSFGNALAGLPHPYETRLAHEPPPRRVAIQRLAALSGFAPLSKGMLTAHPVYGPWIALRGVIVVDVGGPTGLAPRAAAPCEGCPAPCHPAFERALVLADARDDPAILHERWRPWLAVRDSCPVGREHRYSEAQILYHYARRWA